MRQFIFLDPARWVCCLEGRNRSRGGVPDWAKDPLAAGARLLVPEIVHYEIRRELLRFEQDQCAAVIGEICSR